MLILLDCRPLQYDPYNGERIHFIITCANLLSGERDVEWRFLVDGTYRDDLFPGISRERVVIKKAFPGKTGWKLWYDWQIPRLVKKLRPSLLMTTGGMASGRVKIPQCLWMPERAVPGDWAKKKTYSGLYRKRLLESLGLAQVLLTFSDKDKEFLSRQSVPGSPSPHPQSGDKIEVLIGAPDKGDTLLSWVEKEKTKVGYAAGKEYFLAVIPGGGGEELVELLKAFSMFKKRQQSNLQLVLRGGPGVDHIDPGGKLETYKYRLDVHIYNQLPASEWRKLVAASYAFVSPFNRDGLGLDVLNAFKAGVPVITTSRGCLPEIAGDAALFAEVSDPALLASQLMLLYKDERLRGELIGKGEARIKAFTWETTAGKLWNRIEQALKKG